MSFWFHLSVSVLSYSASLTVGGRQIPDLPYPIATLLLEPAPDSDLVYTAGFMSFWLETVSSVHSFSSFCTVDRRAADQSKTNQTHSHCALWLCFVHLRPFRYGWQSPSDFAPSLTHSSLRKKKKEREKKQKKTKKEREKKRWYRHTVDLVKSMHVRHHP